MGAIGAVKKSLIASRKFIGELSLFCEVIDRVRGKLTQGADEKKEILEQRSDFLFLRTVDLRFVRDGGRLHG
jgi:hypothetical protein